MRKIKRIKITVIRTETVFLRKQNGECVKEFLQLQSANLPEYIKNKPVLEIEAIKRTNNTETEGEKK